MNSAKTPTIRLYRLLDEPLAGKLQQQPLFVFGATRAQEVSKNNRGKYKAFIG